MFTEKISIFKWCNFFGLIAVSAMFLACSDDKVAGGSSDDAGIYAVKDLDVAGVSQKGPFVKGSVVTVQGIDCKTMQFTGERFESTVKSDKGDYDVSGINLSSPCAVFEVSGYYLDEVTGAKSADKITLRTITNLKDRKNVNVNVLTSLEYGRVMNLAAGKEMSFAEAKAQAEKEVFDAFVIETDGGEVPEFENLNIFDAGNGNAALLAVSVLMLVSDSSNRNVDVSERMERLSSAIAENGTWNDDLKLEMSKLATDALSSGQMDLVRKNLESLGYANELPQFEKYVIHFVEYVSNMATADSFKIDWSIPKEAHFNPDISYDSIIDSRDGQVYKIVKIGNQIWMAENLNYADSVATPSLLKKNWCYYDKPERCAIAGRLYTWTAAIDSIKLVNDAENPQFCGYLKNCNFPEKLQGICPEGFHLPDTTEWRTLASTVADDPSVAGAALSSKIGWHDNSKGSDDYGFSAFPVGDKYRDSDFSEYDDGGDNRTTSFWSISEDSYDKQLAFSFGFFLGSVGFAGNFKDIGYPVRCIKD